MRLAAVCTAFCLEHQHALVQKLGTGRTSSSLSFTAIKDDTAGVTSTTAGFCSAASSAFVHSSINLPDRASFVNVPTRLLEV